MVPEYDIPIIEALWKPELTPDQRIEKTPTGVVAFRKLQDEEKRIRREWSSTPKGVNEKAWEHVYPRAADFVRAWEYASEKGHKLQAANEKKAAEADAVEKKRLAAEAKKA
jgi:hypothetical protein